MKNLPTFPEWSKEKEEHAEYVALFPNVMIGIHKDHYYAYWLEPVSVMILLESIWKFITLVKRQRLSDIYKSLRKQNYEQWHQYSIRGFEYY